VVDHRSAFAVGARFAPGTRVLHARPESLAEALDLAAVDAAVVMTHHLGHDEACLRALLVQPPAYLGLLGPARRRRELAHALGVEPARIRGPAGLDLGAELPASIALSVMAEIHAVLNGRDGRALGSGA
jgi:xanthine/CO dehydrogenase XdhC/CoxF family maturation factor